MVGAFRYRGKLSISARTDEYTYYICTRCAYVACRRQVKASKAKFELAL